MVTTTELFYDVDFESKLDLLYKWQLRVLIKTVSAKKYLHYPVNCEHWNMKRQKYLIDNDKDAFEKKQYILSCLHNRLNNHSSTDKNE